MTIKETIISSTICLNTFPYPMWNRIGTGSYQVKQPQVSSGRDSTGNSMVVVNGHEATQILLQGAGLVQGLQRLAFRFSANMCGGESDSEISELGGVQELSYSYNGGSGAAWQSAVYRNAAIPNLVLCMSSNGDAFSALNTVTFSFVPRLASSFVGSLSIAPSINTTITIHGQNFVSNGASSAYVKLDRSCFGKSNSSDVHGGESVLAQLVSSSTLVASFRLEPVRDGIVSVAVRSAGTGYECGKLVAVGGSGSGFGGAFFVGAGGAIESLFVSVQGEGYASMPDVLPYYAGLTQCGPDINSTDCPMTGSVVSLVPGKGLTQGCFFDSTYVVGVGGGGYGFKALVVTTEYGQITSFVIVNHGANYTSPPQLVARYYNQGKCSCGSLIINGQPDGPALQDATVLGNMDPCWTASIASGASFAITDYGAGRMQHKHLCAKFGARGSWHQIAGSDLALIPASTSTSFQPTAANSSQSFLLTVTGTGFEAAGAMQTRVKVAVDCDLEANSDTAGAVSGGAGRPCDTLQDPATSGGIQTCITNLTLTALNATSLSVCRRLGDGLYHAVGSGKLILQAVRIASLATVQALSAQATLVTVVGQNFGPRSLADVTVQLCSGFVCMGGGDGEEANIGEPCTGSLDSTTCFGGAACVPNSPALYPTDGPVDCSMPGGEARHAVEVAGCAAGGAPPCTLLLFNFTLLAMQELDAVLWTSFLAGPYAPLPGDMVHVYPSVVANASGVPSTATSLRAFNLSMALRNVALVGAGAARFKYISSDDCRLGGGSDAKLAVVGGQGRPMSAVQGNHSVSKGMVQFQLAVPETMLEDRLTGLTDPKYQTVRLCWTVGSLRYQAVANGSTATTIIQTTRIVGFTPSDSMRNQSLGFGLAVLPAPIFASNQPVTVTLVGRSLGLAVRSGLRIRPVAVTFDPTPTVSRGCVIFDTTADSRLPNCQEFPMTDTSPYGGADALCAHGSPISSVLVQDEVPWKVGSSSSVLVPSTSPQLTTADPADFAVVTLSRTLLRASTIFMLCWRAGVADDSNAAVLAANGSATPLTDSTPWYPIGTVIQRQQSLGASNYYVFSAHVLGISGAQLSALAPAVLRANVPFSISLTSNGVRCVDGEVKLKLVVANALQAVVGGPVSRGCSAYSASDSSGAVVGTAAAYGICTGAVGANATLTFNFTPLVVEFPSNLELCWSTSYGITAYYNILAVRASAYSVLLALPAEATGFTVNNQSPAAGLSGPVAYAHSRLSFLVRGSGLSLQGSNAPLLRIAKACDQDSTVLPGGEAAPAVCVFGAGTYATAEFQLAVATGAARLCVQNRSAKVTWTAFVDLVQCQPTICGAPACQAGTNLLFSDVGGLDVAACRAKCEQDPYCNYYTWYEWPGRVFRKCQTSALCDATSTFSNPSVIPHVLQKTRMLTVGWQPVGTSFAVGGPEVSTVTPQQRPPPVRGTTFAIQVQGRALGSSRLQLHVKLVRASAFGGGCNNLTRLALLEAEFRDLQAQAAAAIKWRVDFAKLNLNGTCVGGNRNCVNGPSPPGTRCVIDSECFGLQGASSGGVCVSPNTGTSCLWPADCTFGGLCNNSRAYLMLTPPPPIPPIQVSPCCPLTCLSPLHPLTPPPYVPLTPSQAHVRRSPATAGN